MKFKVGDRFTHNEMPGTVWIIESIEGVYYWYKYVSGPNYTGASRGRYFIENIDQDYTPLHDPNDLLKEIL